jgi:fructokinase
MPLITSIGEILFDIYNDYKKLGGAPFNFIYHIIKLTGKGNFISRIGDDDNGEEISSFFRKNNISSVYLQTDNQHPTGRAVANLDELKIPHWVIEKNCAYDFIEPSNDIEQIIRKTDCLYFGTLAQRNSVSRKTIQSLFNRGIKYFCDLNIRQEFFTKEIIELSLKASDVLKLNEDELIIVNNLFLDNKYSLVSSAVQLKNTYNIELLCVTCGAEGSYLFKEEEIDYHTTAADKPVDTVGAGDSYAAILCLGFMNGWDLKKLNKTANDFAGKIVMIKGALPDNDDFYKGFKNYFNNE